MNVETQKALSEEFSLPIETLKMVAEARQIDDSHTNGFGGKVVYQTSPAPKSQAYKDAGLTFEQGEEVSWAWIWSEMQEA